MPQLNTRIAIIIINFGVLSSWPSSLGLQSRFGSLGRKNIFLSQSGFDPLIVQAFKQLK